MTPRPLKRYHRPGYPDRLAVLHDPELLRRHLPPAWRRHAKLTAAAGVLLAGLSGCDELVNWLSDREDAGRKGHPAQLAGIIAPPAYLDETDALQIIREELALHGLTLSEAAVPLEGVTVVAPFDPAATAPAGGVALEADLMDPDRRVAVEFLSRYGDQRWPDGLRPQDDQAPLPLTQRLERAGQAVWLGVFADGAITYEPAELQRLLRQQVKDFADWLAAQGAI